jgi:5-methylcytosine-specific restriction endonuclease McrBC GTP-binding regulatory subunit McrB
MTDEEQKQFDEQCDFVQFHPSYDYTDFVEGLRPVQNDDGNVGFERKDGVFKEFCKKALPNFELCYYELLQDIKDSMNYRLLQKNGDYTEALQVNNKDEICWTQANNSDKLATTKVTLDKLKHLFAKYDTSKKASDMSKMNEEIRGIIGGVDSSYYWAVLKEVLHRMEDKKYVFIIDEINRGEISKIFGELFFSIDPGYRGENGKVKTQYQNLIEKDDEFYDGFYVPENVYIIGTMNDIDRSVESMDFAFRRRFAFKEVKAIDRVEMLYDVNNGIGSYADEAKERMNRLNKEIEKIEGLSTAYHIGPAYFLKLKNYDGDFQQLWDNHLEGLLCEYLRGMQNVYEIMEKLKAAYDDESDSNN